MPLDKDSISKSESVVVKELTSAISINNLYKDDTEEQSEQQLSSSKSQHSRHSEKGDESERSSSNAKVNGQTSESSQTGSTPNKETSSCQEAEGDNDINNQQEPEGEGGDQNTEDNVDVEEEESESENQNENIQIEHDSIAVKGDYLPTQEVNLETNCSQDSSTSGVKDPYKQDESLDIDITFESADNRVLINEASNDYNIVTQDST